MEFPYELIQLLAKPGEFVESSGIHPARGRICGK